MKVRALTIDFWNTMVVAGANGERRQRQRMEHLLRVAAACCPDAPPSSEVVTAAYREALRRYDAAWRDRHCTPATTELVRCIWDELALEVDAAQHAEAVRLFEEGLLYGPPTLAEGLPEALAWAAGRYRLGLISDTMFSPGQVIRRFLDRHGLRSYFDAFVFSDETGFSKPDPRAFEQAAAALGTTPAHLAHIGDLRRTDVAGARGAGALAVLYTGLHEDAGEGPAPDRVLRHWRDLPAVLEAAPAAPPLS